MKLASFRPWLLVAGMALLSHALAPPTARAADEVVPLIVIADVPLVDTIRNLARQVGGNLIIDPRVKDMDERPVTVRWENISAREGLERILKERKLVLVTNAATTVDRIGPASAGLKPVADSQVGTNAGKAVPLMIIDGEPLTQVIARLAEVGGLKLTADPQWVGPLDKAHTTVSIRWEKITVRQALVALLDNHDLILVEEGAGGQARIVARTPRDGGARVNGGPTEKKP